MVFCKRQVCALYIRSDNAPIYCKGGTAVYIRIPNQVTRQTQRKSTFTNTDEELSISTSEFMRRIHPPPAAACEGRRPPVPALLTASPAIHPSPAIDLGHESVGLASYPWRADTRRLSAGGVRLTMHLPGRRQAPLGGEGRRH